MSPVIYNNTAKPIVISKNFQVQSQHLQIKTHNHNCKNILFIVLLCIEYSIAVYQ